MATCKTLAVCFLLLFHYVQAQNSCSCDGDTDSLCVLDIIHDPLTVNVNGSTYYFTLCSNIANVPGCVNSSVCVTSSGTTISYGELNHGELNTSTNIITLTFTMAKRTASVKMICDDNLPRLTVDNTTKPGDLHLIVSGDIVCDYGSDLEMMGNNSDNTLLSSSTTMSPSMMSTSITSLSTLLSSTSSNITSSTGSPLNISTTSSTQSSTMSLLTSTTLLPHSGSTSLMTSNTSSHLGPVSLLTSTTPLVYSMSFTLPIKSSSSTSSAPTQPSSSGALSCTNKILITVFVGIPSTAVIVIISVILILVCCKRKKRSGSTYVRLAPTVFFDDDDS